MRAIRLGLVALWVAAVAAPARSDDPRITEQVYEERAVYRLEGRPSVQTMIEFVDGERIENIAVGDSAAWQVTPNKRANLLFVKPLSLTAATNMTVVTDQNTYVFDLIASPQAKPLYALKFASPPGSLGEADFFEDPEPEEQPGAPGQKNPYAIVDPTALRFDWDQSGDNSILPNLVYDDGRRTFLVWPRDRQVPALFTQEESDAEIPLSFAARGQMVIVDKVPSRIILRSGTGVATLTNRQ